MIKNPGVKWTQKDFKKVYYSTYQEIHCELTDSDPPTISLFEMVVMIHTWMAKKPGCCNGASEDHHELGLNEKSVHPFVKMSCHNYNKNKLNTSISNDLIL